MNNVTFKLMKLSILVKQVNATNKFHHNNIKSILMKRVKHTIVKLIN
jgi:hypothetical protein